MLEQQRIQYLNAMGINLWMPKTALPHALPPRWVWDDLATEEAPDNTPKGLLKDVMADVAPSTSAPQTPTIKHTDTLRTQQAEPTADANTPNSASTPRFHLIFLQVTPLTVWVSSDPREHDLLRRFAYRVVTGMGKPFDELQHVMGFQWPYLESKHEDQSEPVAINALKAQWQYFQNLGVQRCVQIGADAQQWLTRVDVKPMFVAESLAELMGSVEKKRNLWLTLRDLPEW